jgi:hypothetical protein
MVDTNELTWLKAIISYTYYNGPIVNNTYHESCCDLTLRLATKIWTRKRKQVKPKIGYECGNETFTNQVKGVCE